MAHAILQKENAPGIRPDAFKLRTDSWTVQLLVIPSEARDLLFRKADPSLRSG